MSQDQVFEITQYELHTSRYRIAAPTAAAAIKELLDGNAEMEDDSGEFVEVMTDRGLPFVANAELGLALQELGVVVEDVLPSIQDVRVVPPDELEQEDLDGVIGH